MSNAAPTERDRQPAKDAAADTAFAEDRAMFEGYAAAGIVGIRQGTSNPGMALPGGCAPVSGCHRQGVSQFRLAGVNGPYSVLLGADA